MAGQSRDTATYQTDFLTNRGVGETFEAYSAIVREDATVTRCRYALLMMVFVVNVSMSLGVLFYVVRSQAPSPPTPRCWRPASKNMSDSDWLVCRHCSEPVNEQCPEVVDQDFCHLASKVSHSHSGTEAPLGLRSERAQEFLWEHFRTWGDGDASLSSPAMGLGALQTLKRGPNLTLDRPPTGFPAFSIL